MFKAGTGAWQAKSSSVPTPPPIQLGSLVMQEVSSQYLMAPRAPLQWVWDMGVDSSSWDGAFPKWHQPEAPLSLLSGAWGPCCV